KSHDWWLQPHAAVGVREHSSLEVRLTSSMLRHESRGCGDPGQPVVAALKAFDAQQFGAGIQTMDRGTRARHEERDDDPVSCRRNPTDVESTARRAEPID